VFAKSKQFLPLMMHPPCYLYSQDVLGTTNKELSLSLLQNVTGSGYDKGDDLFTLCLISLTISGIDFTSFEN
jgi:hypothetical protein